MIQLKIFIDQNEDSRLNGLASLIVQADQYSKEFVRQVSLPCPSVDLLEIAGAATDSRKKYLKTLALKLRTNPTLLVFALTRFLIDTTDTAKSPRALVDWASKRLLAELLMAVEGGDDRKSGWATDDISFWNSFLGNGSSGNLVSRSKAVRNVLDLWLKVQTSLKKGERKCWLKNILSKSFRLSQFRIRIDKNEVQNSSAKLWMNIHQDRSVDLVKKMLKLGVSFLAEETEFEAKLLHAKMEAMRQLAYGASHEINNPLANIAGRAQALMVTENDPDKEYRLAKIYQQAMRAHEMISDMMLFANPPAICKRPVSVRLLMRRLMEKWNASNLDKRFSLRVLIGGNVDRCWVDENLLVVAIDCLLKNSVEAMAVKVDGRGEIELHVRQESGVLNVAVIDSGVGVVSSIRPHLFDPFYSGREAGRGLGFGLSKVWRIAQMHGGTVFLDDDYLDGTKFVISIPVKNRMIEDSQDSTMELLEDSSEASTEESRLSLHAFSKKRAC